ncbi:MAG: DUF5397 family protein [Halothiobacillaceae bacterium]|nr:DUF5397 family protein [Halothiobacillaceae bacterium]
MTTVTTIPSVPTGQIKTFGPFGPKYQVVNALRELDDGDWMIRIKLLETDEEAEYRLSSINDDPKAP